MYHGVYGITYIVSTQYTVPVCLYCTHRGGGVFGPVGPDGCGSSGAARPLLRGAREEEEEEAEEQGRDKVVLPGEEGLHPACPRSSVLAVWRSLPFVRRVEEMERARKENLFRKERTTGGKRGKTPRRREKKMGLSHLGPTN